MKSAHSPAGGKTPPCRLHPQAHRKEAETAYQTSQKRADASPLVSAATTAAAQDRPLRVAAYIRVSTDFTDQENSYETQNRYFTALLEQNPGWVSAGVYSDYAVSGTSRQKRTGYQRLLRHCGEGKIDRIVCKSISRFARNTGDFITALNLLKENKVTILFEKEGLDTGAAASSFLLTTLAAIAQEEARSVSSGIRWSIQKRYPKGHARNYAIYGYRFAQGEGSAEILEDGYRIHRIEVIETEARIVRRIFCEAAEGKTYAAIARELNLERIPAPNHGKAPRTIRGRTTVKAGIETGWTSVMISRILTLERYCGDALLQKTYTPDFLTHKSRRNNGEVPRYLVRNHHPAIISREQFEEVRAIREARALPFQSRERRAPRAFSGRLICASCGQAYSVRNVRRSPIWFCPTAALNNASGACRGERIYEEQLIRMFRKAFLLRFYLPAAPIPDTVRVTDILNGPNPREAGTERVPNAQGDNLISQMRRRLENLQQMDFAERDRAFLNRQILALEAASSPAEQVKKQALEQKLSYLDAYWEKVEADCEARRAALEWIAALPAGQEGLTAFFHGLTTEHVKAFALSILVHDPLHYSIRWFDDTRTEVELEADPESFRSSYRFGGI